MFAMEPALNLEDLKAFKLVAQASSFSSASSSHRIAQSVLSRRVARLESELGCLLFRRSGRGIRLTEQGMHLNERSEEIFNQISTLSAQMSAFTDLARGPVAIALPPISARTLAPLIAREVGEKYPEISLHFSEGTNADIHDWIRSGKADLALIYEPDRRCDIRSTLVVDEPVYLVVPRDYGHVFSDLCDRGIFDFARLSDLPLIAPSRSHGIRVMLERRAAERHVNLNIAFEVDGFGTTKAMVMAGLGCTFFSYAGFREEVEQNTVQLIKTDPPLSWPLVLGEFKNRISSRAVKAVRETMLRELHRQNEVEFWRGNFELKKII